jgi:aspartyl-tRNA(Asn)/glutamyl-tRNA(Gln) amidotransferase subunit A
MTTPNPVTRRHVMEGAAAAGTVLVAGRAHAQRRRSEDLTRLSIEAASRRIAAGELSPVDLTRAYLERIERVDRRINAYITVLGEQALMQARALEAELSAGRNRGPLHGIPLALKDNIDTAGILTTAASAVYAQRVPSEDAHCVERLRAAGAVFLGKLNMHEFAYGGTSAVTHYGPVRNPWDLKRTPGGSSGGSAAAVAARLCAGALGTDTAASIRFPAALCGVVGLKATHGLASIRGIVPLSEWHDHVGPLCRTVADAALVMSALAGYDALDPVSIRAEREDYAAAIGTSVSALRIGVPREPFYTRLHPEIESAVRAALEVLEGLTASVEDVEVPNVDTFAVLSAEIYEYHAPLLEDAAKRALYDPVTLERVLRDSAIKAPDYIAARRRMLLARRNAGDIFANVDLLVTPTAVAPPAEIDAALETPPEEVSMIRNTLPFNALGLPTISVPCGFTSAGLPIGLQITGPRLGEARVLALAHAYEQATEWHVREPLLA